MITTRYLLLIPLCLLLCGCSDQTIAQFSNVLTVPNSNDDLSILLLNELFGNVSAISDSPSSLAGAIFQVFNQLALSVASVLLFYALIVTAVNAANEGKGLGKKASSLWMPFRVAFGLMLLLPKSNGYCLAQSLVMTLTIYGCAAASNIWQTVVTYAQANPLFGQAGIPNFSNQMANVYNDLAVPILEMMTCIQLQSYRSASSLALVGVPTLNQYTAWFQGNTLYFGLTNSGQYQSTCGQINFPSSFSTAQLTAMQNFIGPSNPLWDVASRIAQFEVTTPTAPTYAATLADFITFSQATYQLAASLTSASIASGSNLNTVSQYGWMSAGAYYRELIKMATGANTVGSLPSMPQIGTDTTLPSSDPAQTQARATDVYITTFYQEFLTTPVYTATLSPGNVAPSADPFITGLFTLLGTGSTVPANPSITNATSYMNQASGNLSMSADPFATMTATGASLTASAVAAATTYFTIGAVTTGVASIWSAVQPFWLSVADVVDLGGGFVYATTAWIYGVGATLGVAIPVMPVVMFIAASLGWLLSVIEAMVAAPLVAIGFAWPDELDQVTGRAEPAMMMILNLMLRPGLMIFGLISAIITFAVAANFLHFGFLYILTTGQFGMDSALGYFVVINAYVAALVSMAGLCFGLITHLPDRVLSWIGDRSQSQGGGQEMLGEVGRAMEEQPVSGAFETAEAMAEAMHEGLGRGSELGQAMGERGAAWQMEGGGVSFATAFSPKLSTEEVTKRAIAGRGATGGEAAVSGGAGKGGMGKEKTKLTAEEEKLAKEQKAKKDAALAAAKEKAKEEEEEKVKQAKADDDDEVDEKLIEAGEKNEDTGAGVGTVDNDDE